MKRILAFGASSSKNSINKKLAYYSADQLDHFEIDKIDLNDFEMPIYSIDRESTDGIPDQALKFKELLKASSAVIISFAEHNGSYSAAFKNIYDWMSRIEKPIWLNKPMFLLGTSPGKRGASAVLNTAVNSFPHQGAEVIASFSLPSFHQNFDPKLGIMDKEIKLNYNNQLQLFADHIKQLA